MTQSSKQRLAVALKSAVRLLVRGGYIKAGDADQWITLPKNGEHVLLGEGGEIKAGMGGKFTGKTMQQVKSKEEPKKQAVSAPATAATAQSKPTPSASKPASGAKAHKAASASNLSAQETAALKNYTGSMYVDLNKRLRAGKPPAAGDKKDFENIKNAFAKSATTEDITVFRGVNGEQFMNLKPGQKITDKAYTSTTTAKDTANVFTGYSSNQAILNIEVPKGSRAISAESFSAFKSGGKSENEIILDRNGTYEVTKVEPAKRGKPSVIHVKYIQAPNG